MDILTQEKAEAPVRGITMAAYCIAACGQGEFHPITYTLKLREIHKMTHDIHHLILDWPGDLEFAPVRRLR
jgi:hypothetical protein